MESDIKVLDTIAVYFGRMTISNMWKAAEK